MARLKKIIEEVVTPEEVEVVEKVEEVVVDEFAKRHPGAIPGVIYE